MKWNMYRIRRSYFFCKGRGSKTIPPTAVTMFLFSLLVEYISSDRCRCDYGAVTGTEILGPFSIDQF